MPLSTPLTTGVAVSGVTLAPRASTVTMDTTIPPVFSEPTTIWHTVISPPGGQPGIWVLPSSYSTASPSAPVDLSAAVGLTSTKPYSHPQWPPKFIYTCRQEMFETLGLSPNVPAYPQTTRYCNMDPYTFVTVLTELPKSSKNTTTTSTPRPSMTATSQVQATGSPAGTSSQPSQQKSESSKTSEPATSKGTTESAKQTATSASAQGTAASSKNTTASGKETARSAKKTATSTKGDTSSVKGTATSAKVSPTSANDTAASSKGTVTGTVTVFGTRIVKASKGTPISTFEAANTRMDHLPITAPIHPVDPIVSVLNTLSKSSSTSIHLWETGNRKRHNVRTIGVQYDAPPPNAPPSNGPPSNGSPSHESPSNGPPSNAPPSNAPPPNGPPSNASPPASQPSGTPPPASVQPFTAPLASIPPPASQPSPSPVPGASNPPWGPRPSSDPRPPQPSQPVWFVGNQTGIVPADYGGVDLGDGKEWWGWDQAQTESWHHAARNPQALYNCVGRYMDFVANWAKDPRSLPGNGGWATLDLEQGWPCEQANIALRIKPGPENLSPHYSYSVPLACRMGEFMIDAIREGAATYSCRVKTKSQMGVNQDFADFMWWPLGGPPPPFPHQYQGNPNVPDVTWDEQFIGTNPGP